VQSQITGLNDYLCKKNSLPLPWQDHTHTRTHRNMPTSLRGDYRGQRDAHSAHTHLILCLHIGNKICQIDTNWGAPTGVTCYGVATISRLLKITGLLSRI